MREQRDAWIYVPDEVALDESHAYRLVRAIDARRNAERFALAPALAGLSRGDGPVGQAEQLEEPADLLAVLGGVPQHRRLVVDQITVPPSLAFSLDEAGLDEISQDFLCGSFGDPDLVGDVAEANVPVAGEAEQHLGVIGDELPAAGLCLT